MFKRVFFIVVLLLTISTTWAAAPVVVPIGLTDKAVRENDIVGFAVSATDPDGDALTYLWSIENDPTGKATIVRAENNAITVGVYAGSNYPNPSFAGAVVTVKVDVKDAGTTVTMRFRMMVDGINRPPDLVINEIIGNPERPRVTGEFIGFDATRSSDPDGTEVKFLWIIESVSGGRPCEAALVLFGHYSNRPGFTVPEMSSGARITFYMLVEDGLYKFERRFTGYMAADSTPCSGDIQSNRIPIVSASASSRNPRYGQTVTLTGSASDPDGDGMSYSWLQKGATGGSAVTLSNPNSLNTSFTAPNRDTVLSFEFKATDSTGAAGAATVQISVTREGGAVSPGNDLEVLCSQVGNQAANANAGPDKTVNGGDTVILAGNGSDPDNSSAVVGGLPMSGVAFKWDVFDAKGLTINLQNATTSTATFVAPRVAQDTTIVLALTVKDPLDCGSRDRVSVTIKTPAITNRNPIANAGPDQVVSKGQLVTLTASGSDPDGDAVTFAWAQTAGPTVFLIGANKPTATFLAPKELTQETDLFFRLTATDDKGLTATDEVKIMVKKNNAPQLAVGSGQTVNSGATVGLSATATDTDGDSLTYQWIQVSGPTVTISHSTSLSASFKAPAVQSTTELVFKVVVSDLVASIEGIVKVTVNPVKLNTLVLPYSLQTEHSLFKDTFVGVAVFNPAGNSNNIVVSGVDSAGQEKANLQLPSALPAQGQNALLTTEITSASGIASLVVQGKEGPVQGFFMLGGPGLKKVDGIGGELKESKTLYFPIARHTAAQATMLYLFNPGSQNDPNVVLKLFDQDGVVQKTTSVAIAAQGSLVGTLDKIFGSDLAISEGYVVVFATVPLKGFEFLARAEEFASITAQLGVQTRQLFVPHFFVDNQGGNTEIRLLNIGDNSAFVKIKAFDDRFNSLGTKDVEIAAHKLFVGDLKQLLNLNPSNLTSYEAIVGHLNLDVIGGNVGIFQRDATVVGSITFSGNGGKFLSTLPMLDGGLKEVLFLQVAQSSEVGMFTGLAILNTGTSTAKVKVQVFDEKGVKTGDIALDLPAGNRVVDLLDGAKFFKTGFKQVKGHIRVSSDLPVIAFALFGDSKSEFLAAIEGQASVQ